MALQQSTSILLFSVINNSRHTMNRICQFNMHLQCASDLTTAALNLRTDT